MSGHITNGETHTGDEGIVKTIYCACTIFNADDIIRLSGMGTRKLIRRRAAGTMTAGHQARFRLLETKPFKRRR